MDKNEIINLYKQAFPQTDHEADAGYILGDGTLIDPTSKIHYYCHGKEFCVEPLLSEWRTQHPELPNSNRMAVDAIMNELGAIEFTIDNCHLQCVRVPRKSLTAEQRTALRGIVSKCLERGFIRVSVLGTNEGATYACSESPHLHEEVAIDGSLTVDRVLALIDGYAH